MRSCLIVVFLLTLPAFAAAQSATSIPRIESGALVRIWTDTPDSAFRGRLQSVDPQGVTVRLDRDESRHLLLSELDRIDVSRGRNRWVWTAAGTLVGATAGVVVSRADGGGEGNPVGSLDEVASGIANTISGALIGGVVGFFVAPERWRTVWSR